MKILAFVFYFCILSLSFAAEGSPVIEGGFGYKFGDTIPAEQRENNGSSQTDMDIPVKPITYIEGFDGYSAKTTPSEGKIAALTCKMMCNASESAEKITSLCALLEQKYNLKCKDFGVSVALRKRLSARVFDVSEKRLTDSAGNYISVIEYSYNRLEYLTTDQRGRPSNPISVKSTVISLEWHSKEFEDLAKTEKAKAMDASGL